MQVNLPAINSANYLAPYIKTLIVSCLDEDCPQAIDENAPAQETEFTSPFVEFMMI